MRAVNIIWDLENGDSDYALPKEVELPEEFDEDDEDVATYDDIVDYLSDEYGYCILSCDIKPTEKKKYSVHFSGYYGYDVDVEAKDKEHAEELAQSIFENVNPNKFYFESGTTEVFED